MTTSKNIGRKTFFKYSLITLIVILIIIPVMTALCYQSLTDEPLDIATFYDNTFKDIHENEGFILAQFIIVITAIWFIGGWAGTLIIDKDYPDKIIGFFAFLILWAILFCSCAITSGLVRFPTWGIEGVWSEVLGWLIYGLFTFVIAGIINGLTIGRLFGKEIAKGKQRHANIA